MNAKRKLVLLAALSLVASSTALGGFSFAYFTVQRQQQIKLQTIQVVTPGINITEFKSYSVTQYTAGPTTTSVTFINHETTEMPRYDPQGINYSVYLRAIVVHIVFDYTGTSSTILSAVTNNTAFTAGTLGAGEYDHNFTSNAFQISISSGTTLTSGWTQASLSYTNANSKSFVTFNPTPVKATSFTVKNINPGDTEAWFVIEYHEATMLYISDARSNTDRIVMYEDDIIYRIE